MRMCSETTKKPSGFGTLMKDWPRRWTPGPISYASVTGSPGWFRPRRFRGPRPQEIPGYAVFERSCRLVPGSGPCHSIRCRRRSSWHVLVPRCGCPNRKTQRLECPEGPVLHQREQRSHSDPRQRLRRSQPRTSCALCASPCVNWTPPEGVSRKKGSLTWLTKRRQTASGDDRRRQFANPSLTARAKRVRNVCRQDGRLD